MVLVGERFHVGLIGGEVLRRHDYDLAGEAVAEGVQGGSLFAGLGFGAGGVLGVGPVNFGSMWCRHLCVLSIWYSGAGSGEGSGGSGRWLKTPGLGFGSRWDRLELVEPDYRKLALGWPGVGCPARSLTDMP